MKSAPLQNGAPEGNGDMAKPDKRGREPIGNGVY